MCSTYHMAQILRYIKHYAPLIRLSSELMSRSCKDTPMEFASRSILTGKYSFVVPD